MFRTSADAGSTETGKTYSTRLSKRPERANREQKPTNQVSSIDASEQTEFSQALCTKCMDPGFDIVLEEMSDNDVVSVTTLASDCGFLDLDEVIVQPFEDKVYSSVDCQSDQAADCEDDAIDKQFTETAAAAACISSPVHNAHDMDEDEDEIEIGGCCINLLDTPRFIIDRRSCTATPASVISWYRDDDDSVLLDYDDLRQYDENILPVVDAETPVQGELKKLTVESDTENLCLRDISRGDIDPVSSDCFMVLSSYDAVTDSLEFAHKLNSRNVKSLTSGMLSEPLHSHQAPHRAVEDAEEHFVVYSIMAPHSSDSDTACDQLTAVDDDTIKNQNVNYAVVCHQQPSSGKKRERRPKKQPEAAIDDSEDSLLKNATDEPQLENSDFVLRKSLPECDISLQSMSAVECIKESGLLSEAVQPPYKADMMLCVDNRSDDHTQNSGSSDR